MASCDETWVHEALKEGRKAAEISAPNPAVGCVLVRDGKELSRGHTQKPGGNHAEIEAIEAARKAGLSVRGATAYVTLEPCPMCAGAIINARIPRVFYGARDEAMGACGGVLNLFMERFPFRPALVGGILKDECRAVLADFFRTLR